MADLTEIVDYNIQLWLDLKGNLRKYGAANPRVFNRDSGYCAGEFSREVGWK